MFILQLLQHLFASDILASLGFLGLLNNLQFVEQYFSYLFWRGNIELLSCKFIDTLLDFVHTSSKLLVSLSQRIRVKADAIHFHLSQNRHQRHLYLIEKVFTFMLFQFWL